MMVANMTLHATAHRNLVSIGKNGRKMDYIVP